MSVGGWTNPASRWIQQGMQRYGPGSTYNNNAWIQAVVGPYQQGGARSSYNAPRPVTTPQPGNPFAYPTAPAQTQRPVTSNPSPRSAANVIAEALRPKPTGVGNQTQVRYPNGSTTTYNIMPNDPRPSTPTAPQQVVNPGNTWGIHAGPGVTNDGTIINAPLELGLGPFAQYLQNTATAAAHESNTNQFRGSAPVPITTPTQQNPPAQPSAPRPSTPTQRPPAQQSGGGSGSSTMTTSLPGHVVVRMPNGALRSVAYDRLQYESPGTTVQANYLTRYPDAQSMVGSALPGILANRAVLQQPYYQQAQQATAPRQQFTAPQYSSQIMNILGRR